MLDLTAAYAVPITDIHSMVLHNPCVPAAAAIAAHPIPVLNVTPLHSPLHMARHTGAQWGQQRCCTTPCCTPRLLAPLGAA
jgi:hypothetical protein